MIKHFHFLMMAVIAIVCIAACSQETPDKSDAANTDRAASQSNPTEPTDETSVESPSSSETNSERAGESVSGTNRPTSTSTNSIDFEDNPPDFPVIDDVENYRINFAAERDAENKRRYEAVKNQGLCEGSNRHPDCAYADGVGGFGAVIVPKHAAPFQVQLITSNAWSTDQQLKDQFPDREAWELRHVCGATLIDKYWALTAAHCFGKPETIDPKYFSARLDVGNIAQTAGETVAIEKIIKHPDFRNPTILANDIALLKLDTKNSNLVVKPHDEITQEFNYASKSKLDLAKSVNDDKVLAVRNDRDMMFLDRKSFKTLKSVETSHLPSNFDLFDANRVKLLEKTYSVSGDLLNIIDLKSMKNSASYQADKRFRSAKFSDNGKAVLVIDSAGFLKLFSAEKTEELGRAAIPADMYKAQFINMTRAVYFGNHPGTGGSKVVLMDLETGAEISAFDFSGYNIEAETLKNGEQILLHGNGVFIWIDAQSGETIKSYKVEQQPVSSKTVISPEDELFVFNDGKETGEKLHVWGLSDGFRHSLPVKSDQQGDIAFEYSASNGQILIHEKIHSEDATARLISAKTGQIDLELKSPDGFKGFNLSFFDEGRGILGWSKKGVSHIWQNQKARPSLTIDHSLPISDMVLSDSGKYFVSHSDYGSAEVWDVKTGRPLIRVFHGAPVQNATLFNKDRYLVTRGQNRIRIWEVKSGKELKRFVNATVPARSGMSGGGGGGSFGMDGGSQSGPTSDPTLVSYAELHRDEIALKDGDLLISFGWGKTRRISGFEPSAVLRMLALELKSNAECAANPLWGASADDQTVFCAYDPRRKTCYGDSGGPVIAQYTNASDLRLVGIVSWGSGTCAADNRPSGYTKVSHYIDWIRQEICSEPSDDGSKPALCFQ